MTVENLIKEYATGLTFGGVPVNCPEFESESARLNEDLISRRAIARDFSEIVSRIAELKTELDRIKRGK